MLWPFVWVWAPLTKRARAIILVGDQVLVVKNWFGSGRWQLPGGGIQRGETAAQATEREVLEELGIQVTQGEAITKGAHTHVSTGIVFREHFTLYRLEHKPIIQASKEIARYEWRSDNKVAAPLRIRLLIGAYQKSHRKNNKSTETTA